MNLTGRPRWQQFTALVSLSTGGAITGFSFAPGAIADITTPTSMPIRLMALAKSAQPAASDDTMLRSAIVNVASYYLRMAESKTPAEMEQIIWQHDSLDGVDHGPSCAAFASLTLELGAQVVGQQSWVTGGTSYPWPLHAWADVRVDPNPDSMGITSVLQDAEANGRWHALGDGYDPQPGDWVLFDGHVEVVTKYVGGTLYTIGGDSLPNFSVNAHEYPGPLGAQGVVGFVNNGELTGASQSSTGSGAASPGSAAAVPGSGAGSPAPKAAVPAANSGSAGPQASVHATTGLAAIPGVSPARAAQPATTAAAPPAAPAAPVAAGASGGSDVPGLAAAAAATPAAPDGSAVPGVPVISGGSALAAGSPGQATARPHHHRRAGRLRLTRPGASHAARQLDGAARGAGNDVAVPGTGAWPAASTPAATRGAASIPGLPVAGHHRTARSVLPSPTSFSRQRQSVAAAPPPDTSSQQAFIDQVAPGAVAAQRKYGVPAAVTIAQAIEESGWGQSGLAVRDHNLFGMKGTGPAGTDALPTEEFENGQMVPTTALFRVYNSVAESIDDHGKLLATSGYYRQSMADRHDPNKFATSLTGVYATDPDYGSKLIGLMQQYDLYRYGAAAPAVAHRPPAPGGAAIPGVPATAPAPPVRTRQPEPGPLPSQPAATPQPSQPAATPQPSQPTATPQPSQPTATPQPSQPTATPRAVPADGHARAVPAHASAAAARAV